MPPKCVMLPLAKTITMLDELPYWLALNRLPMLGSVRISSCLEKVGGVAALFTADRHTLSRHGLGTKAIEALQAPDWGQVELELKWLASDLTHHIIALNEPRYPLLLKQIASPPLVLYIKGSLPLLNELQLAIVGSRHPTAGGKEIASEFARYLSALGLVITSGLALGIDAASHRGALAATGKTIAVLGTGIEQVYPPQHCALAQDILTGGGALLSEFVLGSPPKPEHFPRRNRIISGLSVGTLVVEAALSSGSLLTANHALEQGREVFAIPGSIHNPLVRGCHRLIRDGAKLVETVQDITEELGALASAKLVPNASSPVRPPLTPAYATVLQQIDYAPTPIDLVLERSGLAINEVAAIILTLELQGYIKSSTLGYYRQ